MPAVRAEGRLERVSGVPRLLAIGDVQSNYDPLMALLGAAGFAAEGDNGPVWTGGDSALLFLGDLLDGGRKPAEVLWLLMHLHRQAQAVGGRVLLVQGNHELMLFDLLAAEEGDARPLARWFPNGGLDTLLRLAAAVGMPVSERLVALTYGANLGDPENDPEVGQLARAVAIEFAPEFAFLKQHARPAVLVNGSLLAVHASPNLEAAGIDTFVRDDRDEITLAWSRAWLDNWSLGTTDGAFVEGLAGLRRRLADPANGIDLRLLLFAHTPLTPLAVPGFRETQYRVGRLAGPDTRAGTPAVYCLLTAPREVPDGGALGGLLVGGEGVTAIYGAEMARDGRVWPLRERLAKRDPGFPGLAAS